MQIHPTAIVDPGAKLGANVEVGPYAIIARDVSIGDETKIGPHAVIHPFTTVGRKCTIHTNAVIGDLPQDYAFNAAIRSFVKIGDGVMIRENVTIHRGTKPDSVTEVGDECFLMVGAHLAHNVKLGRRVIIVNNALLAGYVEIGDGAIISGGAVIHQFTRIGRLAMLSGLSGIGKDVPPFCVCRGVHLNSVAGLNVVGLRRAGIGAEERKQIKRAFDILYRSGLNFRDVPHAIRTEFAGGPAREIADFVAASKRGVCPLRGKGEAEEE